MITLFLGRTATLGGQNPRDFQIVFSLRTATTYMASSSSCSLSQPLIGSGKDVTHVFRYTEGNTRPVVAWVASASQLRAEAAELCNQASVRTNQTSKTLLVSEFWNQESRDRLSTNASLSAVSSLLAKSSSCPVVTARLFGPAIFEASKLRVLFLGSDKEHPDRLPRIYTLTHSDVTSKITLAVSREINKAQVGTYSRCMAYLNTCSLRFHKNHLLF